MERTRAMCWRAADASGAGLQIRGTKKTAKLVGASHISSVTRQHGMPIVIVGGTHADAPLAADDGPRLAEIFAAGHSMIVDSSELDRDDQQTLASC